MNFANRALGFFNNTNIEFKTAIGDDLEKQKFFAIVSYKFLGNDPNFN